MTDDSGKKRGDSMEAKQFEFRYLLALEPRGVIARLNGGDERETELCIGSFERARPLLRCCWEVVRRTRRICFNPHDI